MALLSMEVSLCGEGGGASVRLRVGERCCLEGLVGARCFFPADNNDQDSIFQILLSLINSAILRAQIMTSPLKEVELSPRANNWRKRYVQHPFHCISTDESGAEVREKANSRESVACIHLCCGSDVAMRRFEQARAGSARSCVINIRVPG